MRQPFLSQYARSSHTQNLQDTYPLSLQCVRDSPHRGQPRNHHQNQALNLLSRCVNSTTYTCEVSRSVRTLMPDALFFAVFSDVKS